MSLFTSIGGSLSDAIGNGLKNKKEDIQKTKQNLKQLGFLPEEETPKKDQNKKTLAQDLTKLFEQIDSRKTAARFMLAKNFSKLSEETDDETTDTAKSSKTRNQEENQQKPSLLSNLKTQSPSSEKSDEAEHEIPIVKGVSNKELLKELREEEGKDVPFMYKDTANNGGKVTVGTGIMLPNVEAAKKLPFEITLKNGKKRLATKAEIEQAFKKVSQITNGKKENIGAGSFNPTTGETAKDYDLDHLTLPRKEIERLFTERARQDFNDLRKIFPEFDTFTLNQRKAILDLKYNTGFSEDKWPKAYKAIRARDWETAAKESYRPQVSDHRNEQTYKWLKGNE